MNDQLDKLNKIINESFGFEIDFNSSPEHLLDVYRHYSDKREALSKEMRFDEQYKKAVLVAETVRVYLREIAPKRRRRK